MLKKAAMQVQKMSRMIRCYLEPSAVNTEKISHFPTLFDITGLMNEVIDDLRLLYPGHLLVLKKSRCVEVYADRDKIAQVIQNVLTNAIKYSSVTDLITVQIKKTKDFLQVAVEDHGIGIRPADQEKIFDRFYRVESQSDMHEKGYGIGLYLCKEIIKQHKGNIWLKSAADMGSKFYFTLPLSSKKP